MKILDIRQFEKLKINSIQFQDLNNLSFYKYFPKTKEELKSLIRQRINEDGNACDLNDIDVSNITDMSRLFKGFRKFNGNISKWDVSNVTNMYKMFIDLVDFNCDISNWNVSNITNMMSMFSGCEKFNQNLNYWNVSKVLTMEGMFSACYTFNQPLDKWHDKIKQVQSFERMFYNCHKFDQDLSSWIINAKYARTSNIFVLEKPKNYFGHYNVISDDHKPKIIIK